MEFENSVAILNDLLVIIYRSLPMFLSEVSPWTHRGDQKAVEAVTDIVTDQKRTCERLAAAIGQRGGVVEMGEYPIEFTDRHFLSLDYLLGELITSGRKDIVAIEERVERLWNDPPAQALAKEAFGAARGYLQSLEELVAEMPSAG